MINKNHSRLVNLTILLHDTKSKELKPQHRISIKTVNSKEKWNKDKTLNLKFKWSKTLIIKITHENIYRERGKPNNPFGYKENRWRETEE